MVVSQLARAKSESSRRAAGAPFGYDFWRPRIRTRTPGSEALWVVGFSVLPNTELKQTVPYSEGTNLIEREFTQ